MKNYSRAYNRYMQHVKFVKRVNKWMDSFWAHPEYHQEEKQKALKGEAYTFLKTTGRPCNCDGCTYLKYERKSKGEINKIILEDLE